MLRLTNSEKRRPRRANAEAAMYERCNEIDAKIEHYKYLSRMVTDQPTLDAIQKHVQQMKADKVALHAEDRGN